MEPLFICTIYAKHRWQYLATYVYPGAGIYAITAASPGPIANNGLIVSGESQLRLDCVSNSSQTEVEATITTSAGVILKPPQDSGGWRLRYLFTPPGHIRFLRSPPPSPLPASDQGIYTCTIPDSTGQNIVLNVGLYPPDFSGELML